MLARWMRYAPVLYGLLMVLLCAGYAKYDGYQIDGDAVAFMDIADALRTHNFALVPNGYWNPGYAAVLAAGEALAHPSRWNELAVFYWTNFAVALGCMLALLFFVRSLVLARERLFPAASPDAREPDARDGAPALSPPALALLALTLLMTSFERELPLGAVRSDALLFLLLLLAAGCLARLVSSTRLIWFPLLGAALGCAYLTKSFAFLPSVLVLAGLFLFSLTRKGRTRARMLGASVLAGVVFLALVTPYVRAISAQRGRLTIGDSGKMNYAFDIDLTDRWHEGYTGRLGHATGDFKHIDHVLQTSPTIYAYDLHPVGTYPPWFDPAYWADGLKPHFWLPGQVQRLLRTTALLVRFLIGRLEIFVVLAVLLGAGCFFSRRRSRWLPLLPVLALGALVFAIYMIVDLQDRYLTGGFFLIAIPVLALLRRPENRSAGEVMGEVTNAVVLLLAGVVAVTALSDIAERRRQKGNDGTGGPYDRQTWEAAQGLERFGITPGKAVACMGEAACVRDFYWARLSRTPIRAQVAVEPETGEAGAFWRSIPDKERTIQTLDRQGMNALVAVFAPSAEVPAGWHQLGASNFYAYILQERTGPVAPQAR